MAMAHGGEFLFGRVADRSRYLCRRGGGRKAACLLGHCPPVPGVLCAFGSAPGFPTTDAVDAAIAAGLDVSSMRDSLNHTVLEEANSWHHIKLPDYGFIQFFDGTKSVNAEATEAEARLKQLRYKIINIQYSLGCIVYPFCRKLNLSY